MSEPTKQAEVDVSALEPDQRSIALRRRLPRARLGPAVAVLLWVLRIYVALAVPLVIYALVRALRG